MAFVSSKGYDVTTSYQQILSLRTTRKYFELQNKTGGTLYILIGDAPEDDKNAIVVGVGESFWTSIPMGVAVSMRSTTAGEVVVLTDGQD